MKLEGTLDRRGRFLHFAPVIDALMLLLIFFLLGSGFVLPSGVAITVPESSTFLAPAPGAPVITISAGEQPTILFNQEKVTAPMLEMRLKAWASSAGNTRRVMIKADRLAPYGVVSDVADQAQQAGLEPNLVHMPRRLP
ncbi:MAG: biopolymer transporter ExbD [Verrucomicrobiales bacterium]